MIVKVARKKNRKFLCGDDGLPVLFSDSMKADLDDKIDGINVKDMKLIEVDYQDWAHGSLVDVAVEPSIDEYGKPEKKAKDT